MRIALLVPVIISIATSQIKIGDIELSKRDAREYLVDCLEYPDTIWINTVNGGYTVTSYTEELDRRCIQTIREYGTPSPESQKINDEYKRRGLKIYYSDGSSIKRYGWIVHRIPGALDYAKYIRRKSSR